MRLLQSGIANGQENAQRSAFLPIGYCRKLASCNASSRRRARLPAHYQNRKQLLTIAALMPGLLTMIAVRATCVSVLISLVLASSARANTVPREQDIADLRLGQRVLVDDGTCPAGQIKEVRGAKMTETGVTRTRSCVPRFGPKTK
jgi:hypothetical protein